MTPGSIFRGVALGGAAAIVVLITLILLTPFGWIAWKVVITGAVAIGMLITLAVLNPRDAIFRGVAISQAAAIGVFTTLYGHWWSAPAPLLLATSLLLGAYTLGRFHRTH